MSGVSTDVTSTAMTAMKNTTDQLCVFTFTNAHCGGITIVYFLFVRKLSPYGLVVCARCPPATEDYNLIELR